MTIRQATLDDLELLVPLVRAYRAFYGQDADPDRERAFLEAHLRAKTSVMFVAVEEDAALGFAQLFTTYSTVYLGTVLILEDLFVAPSARRSGVATSLLHAAIAYARAIKAAGMFLETAFDNDVAQTVYERNGWTREGRFVKYNAKL